ncbi:hypothetical protein [Acidovorax sp. HMWF018]|uniref:hypothetical protein n=1 Tax=Acidovorax sp. HMWF018 TaxID=2056855 RepID=UPI0011B25BD7|nr:hypothetical protein [Acidovorax sp. HMWF018]
MQKHSSTLARLALASAVLAATLAGCSSNKANTPEDAILSFMKAACANDEAAMDKVYIDGKATSFGKLMATAICKESGPSKSFIVTNKAETNGVTELIGKLQFASKTSGPMMFKLKNTPDGWKLVHG